MNVTIYTLPTCHFCHEEKEFLKEHKVDFKEVSLENNKEAQDEMIKVSGQMGTPVSVIDGKVVVGFDREKLIELLGIKE